LFREKRKEVKEFIKKNKEGVYLAIKIAPDCICIFYKKEEWDKHFTYQDLTLI